jgi:hypothetical protein
VGPCRSAAALSASADAILTQCRREESLAVHLLAFSAYTILFDLWKERHGDNALKFALERFLDRREKLVPSSTTFPTL